MFPNLLEKAKTGSWSLNPKTNASSIFFYLLILFLPTQLGKHFWPDFSYVYGLRIDYLSPTLYFTDILIILLLASWFAENLRSIRHKTINKSTIVKLFPFSVIVLFLLLGVFLSKNSLSGWYGFLKLLEFTGLGLYAAKNFRKANATVLFSCFILGVIFESLLAFFQYINQGSLGGIFYFLGERAFNGQTPGVANASINGQLILRPYATFSHPNVLAAYLLVFMLLIIYYSKKMFFKFQNFFLLLTLTIGSAGLFLSMGRVAIVFWIFSLGVILFRRVYKKNIYTFFWTNRIFSFIFLTVIVSLFFFPVGMRFLDFNLADQTVVQRETLIQDSLVIFWQNPVFGTGLNNFLANLPKVQNQLHQEIYLQPVHNIFLLVLTETGIAGLLLSIYFFFLTYKRIEKNKNTELYLLFFAIIFLGMFDHYFLTLQQGQIMLSLLLGLFWGLGQKDKKLLK